MYDDNHDDLGYFGIELENRVREARHARERRDHEPQEYSKSVSNHSSRRPRLWVFLVLGAVALLLSVEMIIWVAIKVVNWLVFGN